MRAAAPRRAHAPALHRAAAPLRAGPVPPHCPLVQQLKAKRNVPLARARMRAHPLAHSARAHWHTHGRRRFEHPQAADKGIHPTGCMAGSAPCTRTGAASSSCGTTRRRSASARHPTCGPPPAPVVRPCAVHLPHAVHRSSVGRPHVEPVRAAQHGEHSSTACRAQRHTVADARHAIARRLPRAARCAHGRHSLSARTRLKGLKILRT